MYIKQKKTILMKKTQIKVKMSCLQLHSVKQTDDFKIIWITPQVAGVTLAKS